MTGESAPPVVLYFDLSCPWSYLASVRLVDVCTRTGSRIDYRPVLVDRVRRAVDSGCSPSRCDPLPAREAWKAQDRHDWAEFVGVPLSLPQGWPHDSARAAAGAIEALAQGCGAAYIRGVFTAYFGHGRLVDDDATLIAAAEAAGCDVESFRAALDGDAPRAEVRDNEAQLLAQGGFGAPSLFVGERLFFGNDRIPLVEFALGQASGRKFVMPGQHGP